MKSSEDQHRGSEGEGAGEPEATDKATPGYRKVPLCPECLERMRSEPGAREVLLAEGPSRSELRSDSVRAAACCHTDRGELSTDHAASSCGQLVLVLDGEAYGPRPGERSGE